MRGPILMLVFSLFYVFLYHFLVYFLVEGRVNYIGEYQVKRKYHSHEKKREQDRKVDFL